MGISPLIKWSGGKRSEIELLAPLFPPFSRIVEPFAGGAAVSLACAPEHIVLNDVSSDLISFYQTMTKTSTRTTMLVMLDAIDQARKNISKDISIVSDQDVQTFYHNPKSVEDYLTKMWKSKKWVKKLPNEMGKNIHQDIWASIKNKLHVRVPNLEKKHGQPFPLSLKREQLLTAVMAGLYTTLRRIYNHEPLAKHLCVSEQMACWYAVRSLCYSGMFRYGKNGAFNVPYGGMSYNSRDFQQNIQTFQSDKVKDVLQRVHVHQMDFEQLFNHYHFFNSTTDFVFLDPPYDSAFSQYNKEQDFTASDQKRLAHVLKNTTTPWMLVVKNTPLMLSLYNEQPLYCYTFAKNYQVNIRSRNERAVEHLVVTNYIPPSQEGLQLLSP